MNGLTTTRERFPCCRSRSRTAELGSSSVMAWKSLPVAGTSTTRPPSQPVRTGGRGGRDSCGRAVEPIEAGVIKACRWTTWRPYLVLEQGSPARRTW